MRYFLLSFFLFFATILNAQKIHGIVFNEKGELLPYSSVTIKGTSIGASANNNARYAINLSPGTYTVVCQHIGYTTSEKTVTLKNEEVELMFFLSEQKLELKEVIVKSRGEDPAYEIIRSAIKLRPLYAKEVKAFTCDLYAKDMIKLRKLPKKILGQSIPDNDRKEMGLDTTGAGIIYLSESISKVAKQLPDNFKLEVNSSRVSGSDGFGFTFPTFISLYQNNVIIFTQKLNPRGFISPIADGALNYYYYKYLGSFWEDGKEINSIKVTPRRSYEPLFSGVINIAEASWRIHSLDLVLTKKAQLEIVDTLQLTQFHVPVSKDAWRIKNQVIHFNFNMLGIDAVGNFVSAYSNYNVNPVFAKKYFDNVIIKYDTGVSKKPKSFWDKNRPIPLEKEETKNYLVKDSVFEANKDAVRSKVTVDSLNREQSKIRPLDLLWNGINRRHYSKTNSINWSINPLLKALEYNPAEGLVVNVSGNFSTYLKKKKTNLLVSPNFRYGFSNKHFNGWLDVSLQTRDFEPEGKLKRETWSFSAGSRVTQFNRESPISPLINSISTLFYGDNFMKTYENIFANIGFAKRYENGLRMNLNLLYEDRKPLNNTTNYSFFKKDSSNITPNFPYERIASQFNRHQAVIASFDISFTPGQKYIQFPNNKVAISSKYPTFSFNYSKGINSIFGSDVNFNKWKFTVTDDLNFRIAGLLKYKISFGGFLSDKTVFIQDFQHFNGNLTAAASEYVNSFQLVSYYANSTTTSFYTMAHLEHHLNGLLTNKIPWFNKLNWHLVAGTNAFYVNQNSYHIEVFAGIENILKLFRVDVVTAFINGGKTTTGVRIGYGGLLGSNISTNKKTGAVSISF